MPKGGMKSVRSSNCMLRGGDNWMASYFCVLLSYSLTCAGSSLFGSSDFFFAFPGPLISFYKYLVLSCAFVQVYALGLENNWFTEIEHNHMYPFIYAVAPRVREDHLHYKEIPYYLV